MTVTDTAATGTETPIQPAADAPAVEFTEGQARQWLASNDGAPSVRLLARLWSWHPSKVQRFLKRERPRPDTAVDTPPADIVTKAADTLDTPDTPSDAFDVRRSECILPPRTTVFAYVDEDTGGLRIWGSDAAQQCDTELRINAEDVHDFINGLVALVRDHGGAQ